MIRAPAWSPDGHFIAVNQNPFLKGGILLLSYTMSPAIQIAPGE
jgi:hypothetical protein